ncbi:LacI family DNA-binding transcriptional regulator [Mycetocola miduiensis]|uniref:Transcriptional regulator, LacI family n=1 Tax=Mycetocola miduiensis TaxID=995034 RepID=A0A1I4YHH2_9MICO|nr:LacI family DNA-binding transcriptional regulator [Mycetocola miduiensis]SFN37475.1 transcriptional regulator, LacI family [Mycetocola miduiensis]
MGSAIADVAARAGVSKATASRALSGKGYVAEVTRQRVVQAAKEIGFVASPNAASLVTGHTKNIGVVIPFINRWFFGEILEGVEEALLNRGYDMTLYNIHPGSADRDRVFDFFLARKRFDGVIVIGVEPTPEETARLLRLDIPLVSVGAPVADVRSLTIDDEVAGRLATEHLIGLGHRRILHMGGTVTGEGDTSVHGRRMRGYVSAMTQAGLEREMSFAQTEMSVPGGYDAGAHELSNSSSRPTAVFAACDEIAIGVIIAARRLGLAVPGDLSLVGIDGHEYAEMFSLTTIEQQPRAQGQSAVTDLLAAVSGESLAADVVDVPARLVVRASTTFAQLSADAV